MTATGTATSTKSTSRGRKASFSRFSGIANVRTGADVVRVWDAFWQALLASPDYVADGRIRLEELSSCTTPEPCPMG
jgi:hypothetical protein